MFVTEIRSSTRIMRCEAVVIGDDLSPLLGKQGIWGSEVPQRGPRAEPMRSGDEAPISSTLSSAYTAQNSTNVAQNSRCFRPVEIPYEHLDPPECHGVHMAYVRISHEGRGTKFVVYGTKQHKSSTKFWCGFYA